MKDLLITFAILIFVPAVVTGAGEFSIKTSMTIVAIILGIRYFISLTRQ
jgi:hypothetical protein